MIDDLKQIHQHDKEDMLGAAATELGQLKAQITWSRVPSGAAANVVYVGAGGTSAAALLAQVLSVCDVPFEITSGYELPGYVDERTIFIVCAWPGATEEMVELLRYAAEKGAQVAVITADETLARMADQNEYALMRMQDVYNSKPATLYILKALVMLLEMKGVTGMVSAAVTATAVSLEKEVETWLPAVPTRLNLAKQIAQECMGRSVVICAGPKLAPAAHYWKMTLNENAKQLAWCEVFSEFNYNELAGWSGQPEQKPYTVIELRSGLDSVRIQKRFEVAGRLLSGMRPSPNVVEVKGTTTLEKLLWAIVLADFSSAYLALLNGYDPASHVVVDKIKRAMGDYNDSNA